MDKVPGIGFRKPVNSLTQGTAEVKVPEAKFWVFLGFSCSLESQV